MTGLPKMDTFGSIDPYFSLKIIKHSKEVEGKVIQKSYNPEFNQRVEIEVKDALFVDLRDVVITVKDSDKAAFDEEVGIVALKFNIFLDNINDWAFSGRNKLTGKKN